MRFAVIALFVALVGVPTTPASAQPEIGEAADKKRAATLLSEGDTHFRRGDYYRDRDQPELAREQYEIALGKYEAAFDTFPSTKIYYPIARAEERLGRHLEAIRHYRQLIEESEEIDEGIRSKALDRIDAVKERVVVLVLIVDPDGATIVIDGEVRGEAPVAEPFILEPGEHTIAVTAPGYTPFETTEPFDPGDQEQRTISLEKIPIVVKEPVPRTPSMPEGPPRADRTPLWIGLGTTGALAAMATVTGLVAVSKQGIVTDDSLPMDERIDARDSGRRFALVTDILWLGALGAGAYTAYYYYEIHLPEQRALDEEAAAAEARGLWMAPYADDEGGGVAVGGRF